MALTVTVTSPQKQQESDRGLQILARNTRASPFWREESPVCMICCEKSMQNKYEMKPQKPAGAHEECWCSWADAEPGKLSLAHSQAHEHSTRHLSVDSELMWSQLFIPNSLGHQIIYKAAECEQLHRSHRRIVSWARVFVKHLRNSRNPTLSSLFR